MQNQIQNQTIHMTEKGVNMNESDEQEYEHVGSLSRI